jgi:hypothetical protein
VAAGNSDPSQDILDGLSPADSAENDVYTLPVCDYAATLHSAVKEHLRLTLKDARLLRTFIAASNGDDCSNLQPLDNAMDAAVTGIREEPAMTGPPPLR